VSDDKEVTPPSHKELGIIDSGGVDEISVIPWSRLLHRKVTRHVTMTHRKATLLVLLASVFTVSFTITLLVVSLKTVADDVGTSVSVMSWVITGPLLAFGVVGPAFGKAGDLWGHKRLFVYGLVGAGIFALGSAFAWNALSLIVLRTLSAASGSATGPAAMAYINRLFADDERVRPLGVWSFVTAGAPVLGVVAGTPLVEAFGWRVIFLIQVPLCLLGAALSQKLLPDTERQPDVRFDVKGSLTLGTGAVLVLLTINRGNSWGWVSVPTIGAGVLGVAALWLFYRIESRIDNALMPVKWLRMRNVAFPVITVGLMNVAYMGSFLLVPQMLENALDYTPSHIGWLVISRPLVFSLIAPMAGYIVGRLGERNTGVWGAFAIVAAMVILTTIDVGVSDWVVIAGLGLTGFGMGIAAPSLMSLLSASVETADMGVASAMQQLMSQMGAVLGGALMIAVHDITESSGAVQSYSYGLYVGVVAAVGAVITARMVRSPRA
jgi:MFS family permease